MHVISRVIESLEAHLRPYVSIFVHHFPSVWDSASDQNILRATLLDALTTIITTLGVDSQQLHAFVLQVLEYALNPSHTEQAYLEEQALELCEQTVKMAPVMTQVRQREKWKRWCIR